MINLLPTSVVTDVKLSKLRRQVYAITTSVLVGYLLVLAGIGGRGWYLSSKDTSTSTEVEQLTGQINQLAPVEATLRQQTDRIKLIHAQFNARQSSAEAASILAGAEVTAWVYQPPIAQDVIIVGPNSSDLENFATSLSANFSSVTLKRLSKTTNAPWQMELSLKGGNP